MKKLKLIITVFIGLALFSSCSKEEAPPPTSLELTIQDNIGNITSGATVKLYSSQSDMKSDVNQIESTMTSDATGKVKFNGLSNIKYYWSAEKGCMNNVYGTNTTTSPLTLNVNNEVNVIMSGTGTFQFICSSNNPYRIYLNGIHAFDINGNSIIDSDIMPTGSYSVRVLQLSGYLVYPTDETYNVTLDCGESQSILFPQTKKSDS